MNKIHLRLTLSVAGPRAQLLQMPQWPMALRITAAFAEAPSSPAEARALITRSLPWNIWKGKLPDVLVVTDQGKRIRCVPEEPLEEASAFLEAVKQSIEDRGHALCDSPNQLTFLSGEASPTTVLDDGVTPGVPWGGLLKSIASMCMPTPSALKATWFFMLDRDAVCEVEAGIWKLRKGATLSAAPSELEGKSGVQIRPVEAAMCFDYEEQALAYCNLLALEPVLFHSLDELDNHWLSIRDSRDDSLLDLASQLDVALSPSKMLGALRLEELIEVCVCDRPGEDGRACTPSELAEAASVWRTALESPDVEAIAEARRTVIKETTLSTNGVASDAFRESFRKQAALVMEAALPQTANGVRITSVAASRLPTLLEERLLPRAFQAPEPKPSKSGAGEGITLVVGDERLRLAHEEQKHAPSIDEVAAVQLWARRSSDPAALSSDSKNPATWHALTGGRLVDQADSTNAGMDRVLGCSMAYVDDVLYREFLYVGSNMVCRNPLEDAHREEMGDGEWALKLARVDREAADSWVLRAVPLRYGDHYEFAASVIDRAGGQADELCDGKPWKAKKLSELAGIDPPQRDGVHFLRRVPVGDCSVIPPAGGWPQAPKDVVLRSLECEPKPQEGKQHAAICLVPDDPKHFNMSAVMDQAGNPTARPKASFSIEPPLTDEQTVLRWHMPATNVARGEQEAGLQRLSETLAGILQRRDDRQFDEIPTAPDLVPDPAVSAIGIRWQADGEMPQHIELPVAARAFDVKVGSSTGFDKSGTFTVAPGRYLRIGILPLVKVADFERFDGLALQSLVEPTEWKGADGAFRAFKEDVVLVECATHEMPELDAALLNLSPVTSGDVDVTYAFSKAAATERLAFKHVDGMTLSSTRWKWRNLPIPPKDPAAIPVGTPEWRRRFASGPPKEIIDPQKRDSAMELVDYFDELSGVDAGFVKREKVNARFPRSPNPLKGALIADDVVLFRDSREGTTPADYLQYMLTMRSRYAGVLQEPERSTQSPRRVAVGFRGDLNRIKPPRVLAVMPLLSRMPSGPRKPKPGDGTPFLVVLDEIWFREYGIGERLQARIALTKREIGEPVPTQRRYGPLPDHSLDVSPVSALPADPVLDCFGPFGFTLDRTDDQALANATGFVVYPPEGTPAHFNLFVEFERVLDIPSGDAGKPAISETTAPVPMYTLPDSAELWPNVEVPDGQLTLTPTHGGRFSYTKKLLNLSPIPAPHADLSKQYRYLLIAGTSVRDGGRGVDVFAPTHALWLDLGTASPLGGSEASLKTCTRAVVAEILLSGRHDPGTDPLADAKGLGELFKRMLPESIASDSPGMFRRFSKVGKLEWR